MHFLVFTDLHYDTVPDGDRRLKELMKAAKEKEADFILNLGDTCHPKVENQKIVGVIQSCGIPCYTIPGNHDTGIWSESEVLSFWGIQKAYYSMIYGNVKFVFLNTVELQEGAVIPDEQIAWLQEELKSNHDFVILTHQSLSNDYVTPNGKPRGIRNRKEIRSILERIHGNKRVLLCINGHDHGCDVKQINGIYYYTLNSASYIWQNVKETFPYGEDIHARYPHLKNMILYKQALHCMVAIDDIGNVVVEGIEGNYLTVSPESIGMHSMWNGVHVMPNTLSIGIKSSGSSFPQRDIF